MEKEREREELRLAEREAERTAKRAKAAQENEAKKQLAMAQRGMTEEQKEVRGKRPSLTIPPLPPPLSNYLSTCPPFPQQHPINHLFCVFFFFYTFLAFEFTAICYSETNERTRGQHG